MRITKGVEFYIYNRLLPPLYLHVAATRLPRFPTLDLGSSTLSKLL